MKVYIMTDLEGVAGVSTFYVDTTPDGPGYPLAKKLLTGEINAAVEGLLEQGVDEIVVCDGHGPGAIDYEGLHPRAQLMHGRPLAPMGTRNEYLKDFDVCMMLGQHAMAGTPMANMCHTQNSRQIEYYKLNGEPIGEIAQFALKMGALGIPMIYLSGDDAACREAETLLPGIKTTEVKKSLDKNYCVSPAKEEARRRIREGVQQALIQHQESPLKPLVWEGPFVLEKRFYQDNDRYDEHPLLKCRIDSRTIQLQADDILSIIYA